jgi:hypothetical protein
MLIGDKAFCSVHSFINIQVTVVIQAVADLGLGYLCITGSEPRCKATALTRANPPFVLRQAGSSSTGINGELATLTKPRIGHTLDYRGPGHILSFTTTSARRTGLAVHGARTATKAPFATIANALLPGINATGEAIVVGMAGAAKFEICRGTNEDLVRKTGDVLEAEPAERAFLFTRLGALLAVRRENAESFQAVIPIFAGPTSFAFLGSVKVRDRQVYGQPVQRVHKLRDPDFWQIRSLAAVSLHPQVDNIQGLLVISCPIRHGQLT